MRIVFADTGYWIGILNRKDEHHAKAQKISSSLGSCRIITSELVLVELLNGLAGMGADLRKVAAKTVAELRKNSNVDIEPMTSMRFRKALELYERRLDKAWSLTDCASFSIMQEHDIKDALSPDKHFKQAGFRALMLDNTK